MGIGEQIKGTLKEKAGDLTDNDELQAEGNAQQTKGEAEADETQARAEAKAHEKKADALEREQESLEN
jgi:uncharacterized protein YjbJ (UPF0337 family)